MPSTGLLLAAILALPAAVPAGRPAHDDYAAAIRERVWVETGVDSDRDGVPDRVAVRVIRPPGRAKVPVILQASPYHSGLNPLRFHDDLDRGGWSAPARRAEKIIFDGYLDNYFVPRGYAVVQADSLGTGGSTGCPTSGGRTETLGMKAVVEWLSGRAQAYDRDGAPVRAGWSTGNTGMIGVSYDGTLPTAVATTGVPGLRTIVPIAAISSWYDYYRANGGVVAPGGYPGEDADVLARAVLTRKNPGACAAVMDRLERDQDRVTGDHSPFWAERDYVRDAARVRASVFLVHGLHDLNVRTQQFGRWWQALAAHDVPRKIWLHQAGHADPFDVRRSAWLRTLHRWLDHWLKGIDTGIMREPMADVETAPGRWQTARSWPVPGSRPVTLTLGGGPRRTFVDNPALTADELVAAAGDRNRFSYLTPPLPGAVRWSGTARVSVRADLTGDSPYLTALLVDHGPQRRYAGLRDAGGQDCVGPGVEGDPGCFGRTAYDTTLTPYEIVSRGWIDVRDHRPHRTFRWNLQPGDHVFAAGHRIGVIVISTDRDHTLRYPAGTVVGVEPAASQVVLDLTR